MSAVAVQEPFADYLAAEGVNFSRLKRMQYSPAHYACEYQRSDTPALSLGRLIHLATLEPALFEAIVIDDGSWPGGMTKGKNPRPTFNRNSSDYKEWRKGHEESGRQVESASDIAICRNVAAAVRKHPIASMYLSWPGTAEVSIQWEHPLGIACKSRLDWVGEGAILDLKSAKDIRPDEFAKACERYHYYAQAAFYTDAVKALTGEVRPFKFIAVEKSAPFDVVVYDVPEDSISAGRVQYQDWLLQVLACRKSGDWPGVSSKALELERPSWAVSEMDDCKLIVGGEEIRV